MTQPLSRRGFLKCAACAAGAVALAACAPASTEPAPPEIAYGQEVCAGCGMVIDTPRFACATLLTTGEYLKFDDLGDLAVHHMDYPNLMVRAVFVHDFHTEAWARGETAAYVYSPLIASPMGHGLAAFAERAAAEAYAASNCGAADCMVMNYDEMRAHVHMRVHG